MRLSTMFLNIFNGCPDEQRLGRIAAYVRQQDPDVLGLSELCHWRRHDAARMRQFAERVALPHWVLCESQGIYDIGLLAKRPLGEVMTTAEGISNGLLLAQVPIDGAAPVAVMVLHLTASNEDDRRRELEAVTQHAWGRERLVVMGDMNALSPSDLSVYERTEVFRRVRAAGHTKYGTEHLRTDAIAQLLGFGLVDAVRMTRGDGPFVPSVPTPFSTDPHHNAAEARLDYLFVSTDLARGVVEARIDASEVTDHLSDHRPVLATLAL